MHECIIIIIIITSCDDSHNEECQLSFPANLVLLSGMKCRTQFVIRGSTMAQAVSRPPLTAEFRVWSQALTQDSDWQFRSSSLSHCHATTGPLSSASTCHYCQKEKRTKAGNLQTHQRSLSNREYGKNSCSLLVLQTANLNETTLKNFEVLKV